MSVRIIIGDALDRLRELPDASVHCVVTSPPYWGLRDYGVAGQLGLEADYREYVANMIAVFREVHRALRPDGTLWLNLGDSYATGAGSYRNPGSDVAPIKHGGKHAFTKDYARAQPNRMPQPGLKPKDLTGIPWRVAFALQEDGWWLRQDIIWSKPNPMPESIKDRCTKAHEYLFLLSKSQRYYFDADAISEPASPNTNPRRAGNGYKMPDGWDTGEGAHGSFRRQGREKGRPAPKLATAGSGIKNNTSMDAALAVMPEFRNRRSVWEIPAQPFSEAHFATFPPALIEPCILAGCPTGGTVLDPFGGSGTTGLVADRLCRNAILIELNPDYAAMARRRITNDGPLFAAVAD